MPSRPKPKKKRHLNYRNLVIILIIIGTIAYSTYYLFTLRVKNIVIHGNAYTKDVTIIEKANLTNYPKILKINKKQIIASLKTLPLVKDVAVKKDLKGHITIDITENYPLFYYQSTNTAILSDGSSLNDTKFYGLPTLVNYVPEDILKDFTTQLSKIDPTIVYMINEIEYQPDGSTPEGDVDDPLRFVFSMNDGNTVYINTVYMQKFKDYLSYYDSIVKKYGTERGVIMLDSESDAHIFTTYKELAKTEGDAEGED